MEEDIDVSLKGDALWGVAFSFRDAEIERRYREQTMPSKIHHDIVAYLQGLFPGSVLTYLYRGALSPLGMLSTVTNPLLALFWLCMCLWKKEAYSRRRNSIICFHMFHSMLMFNVLAKTEEAPNATWFGILGRIVLKSPVLVTLYASSNLSLFVRNHILVQLCTLPLILIWAVDFCEACCPLGGPENEVVESLGEVIQFFVVLLPSFFLPRAIECSCFTVVSSVMFLMGVLVPIAFVYMLDITRRKAFIAEHFPGKLSSELKHSLSQNLYSIWYVVLLAENIWMGCCVLIGL